MSADARLALLVREFRIATEDPDDHGSYQISKDSLRLMLDALEEAEEHAALVRVGSAGRLHPAVIKLRQLRVERDSMVHRCVDLAQEWERGAGMLTQVDAARLLRLAVGAPIAQDGAKR